MNYHKTFDPSPEKVSPLTLDQLDAKGDRRDGLSYVYSDDIILKVNIALATGRPLLVRGPSGAGKSSLAPNIARFMKWRYYEFVVTSRTQARDLLYTFDTLRRLSDAELGHLHRKETGEQIDERLGDLARYIEPGSLWWALDRETAATRGVDSGRPGVPPAEDPNRNSDASSEKAVVLIDEIDKADPDVPNDLLVPFGSLEFHVAEIDKLIRSRDHQPSPLFIITTNQERELPNAFMRRCLILDLAPARPDMLKTIARQRFGVDKDKENLYSALADLVDKDKRPAGAAFTQSPLPSIAEYLDALQACFELNITPDRSAPIWQKIESATLWKPREGGGR
jgi:MoxR-like ATPase